MYKHIFILLIFCTISCQINKPENNSSIDKKSINLKENQEILSGKITRKQFTNKGGRKPKGIYDYYFKWKEEKRFIKTVKGAGGMTKDQLEPYLNKNVEVIITLREGSWDTDPTSDFPVQSRGGKYVIIYEIVK